MSDEEEYPDPAEIPMYDEDDPDGDRREFIDDKEHFDINALDADPVYHVAEEPETT